MGLLCQRLLVGRFGLAEATAALAIACSSSFPTPLAHPVNLLMLAPGAYRFRDYARFGAGLMVVCLTVVLLGARLLPAG